MLLVGKELDNHDPDVWFSCNKGRQSHHLEFTGSSVFVFCGLPQLELRSDASFIHFQTLSQFKQVCVSVCVCVFIIHPRDYNCLLGKFPKCD